MASNLKNTLKGKADEVNGAVAPAPEKKKPTTAGAIFKSYLEDGAIKSRFEQTLKDKAPHFITSLLTLYNGDSMLQKCDPMSVISCAMKAAALDLPIDKNLGYMWVIAYRNWKVRDKEVYYPEAQMGYKGYIQLALRTGQYKAINAIPIYEGEFISYDRLTEELVLNMQGKKSNAVVGYAGYFELINGFRKKVFWTVDDIKEHRAKFSKQKEGKGGTWDTEFDAMAVKTVLRNMLSKWGILSIEMQRALSDEITAEVRDANEDGDPVPEAWESEPQDVNYTEVEIAQETEVL